VGAHFDSTDIESEPASVQKQVPAAKLHVLQLEPIKAKLGPKWEKLSALVHTLFEKSLRRAQGPADHFLLVDEMSYVVTFHDLSLQEASLACASVAKEVCDLLFGADVDDIMIRGLVALVPPAMLENAAAAKGHQITEFLERTGGEIIVTQHDNPQIAWESIDKPAPVQPGPAGEWTSRSHLLAEQVGLKIGYFPVWDLAARKSASLFLSALNRSNDAPTSARHALRGIDEPRIANFETTLLQAAAEYALTVHAAQKVCALGVGVSYETLSGFHSRIHYIGALKAIRVLPDCPLLLRIDQVPDGTPVGRLAEIVAMLSMPNVRVTVQFESLRSLPEMGIRLGALGIGGSLPANCDAATAAAIAQRLVRRATEQKAFAFLHGLDNDALVDAALKSHVRFGSGRAIDAGRHFTGKEAIPDFPLRA
jgi:hypothetical protein